MEPNEKLLSFSRFQIGLSKADLQPISGVCMTRTQLEDSRSNFNSRTVVGQIGLLLQPSVPYGPAGCIILYGNCLSRLRFKIRPQLYANDSVHFSHLGSAFH